MSIVHLKPPPKFDPKFEIAVCFIEAGGKFLFLHRQVWDTSGDKWCLPGGGVHDDETPAQCVMRETREETSIDLSKEDLKFIKQVFVRYPEHDYINNEFYVKLRAQPEVKVNFEEHKDFRWVTLEEAMKLDLIRGGQEGLQLFMEK
ncbi:MAG: NUDIX hydrolase [Candidatus Taylorbacteria bacterium]|nr:NUDIX hydrolase [Candidatus Taylorbacteria bacterium]